MELSARGRSLKPSETLAVKARAQELKAQGRKIIDLSVGEPDIDTPDHIKAAAVEALKAGQTKYTAVAGIPDLRAAIAKRYESDYGLKYKAEQVIFTNGGKQALYSLFQVTVEPGDEVVVLAPYWVSYPPMVELAGGKVVVVKASAENGFKVSPEDLESALTAKTKWVIINSPSNPTGCAYSLSELKALGAVIAKSQAGVVSDEIYEKIVFNGFEFYSFPQAVPEMIDRTVVVNGFSKTYAMTGWRAGYAVGPKNIIDAMGKHMSQETSNVCSFAQYGALEALRGKHDFVDGMVAAYNRRIDLAMREIAKCKRLSVARKPEGAFYLFVSFKQVGEIRSSAAMVNYLLEKAGVAAVPGEAFGDDSSFRISMASSDSDIENGIKAIIAAVEAA